MSQRYENIMVAVDGSYESELAFENGVQVALRNDATLVIAHVIDTRTFQGEIAFDTTIYDRQREHAETVLSGYEEEAKKAGVTKIKKVIKFGNPKTILATEIPDEEGIDLIMVGATGLNAFERVLIGSSSEYIFRHAKVDILIVRDSQKTF